jgi:hypothetical protein
LRCAHVCVCQVEAAAVRREEELKEVETREEAAFRELAVLKEQVFKQSQSLFNLRKEESQMIADIATSQSAAKNLMAKIHKLDQESLRQQELVYTAEFQIQLMERKVCVCTRCLCVLSRVICTAVSMCIVLR